MSIFHFSIKKYFKTIDAVTQIICVNSVISSMATAHTAGNRYKSVCRSCDMSDDQWHKSIFFWGNELGTMDGTTRRGAPSGWVWGWCASPIVGVRAKTVWYAPVGLICTIWCFLALFV